MLLLNQLRYLPVLPAIPESMVCQKGELKINALDLSEYSKKICQKANINSKLGTYEPKYTKLNVYICSGLESRTCDKYGRSITSRIAC